MLLCFLFFFPLAHINIITSVYKLLKQGMLNYLVNSPSFILPIISTFNSDHNVKQ